MDCIECGLAINGKYFEVDGKSVCEKDYDEVMGVFLNQAKRRRVSLQNVNHYPRAIYRNIGKNVATAEAS